MQPVVLGESAAQPGVWILSTARGETVAVLTSREWGERIAAALARAQGPQTAAGPDAAKSGAKGAGKAGAP